jgi:hypothetical protein
MEGNMFRKLVATATFATALAVAGQAGAVVIDSTSYTGAGCLANTNTCSIGGATLTAQGGAGATFSEATFRGQLGLGINSVVTGQERDKEIQGDPTGGAPEGVLIEFNSPQIVTEILLAHFSNPDEFSGDPQEISMISANGPSGTLQVLDNLGNFTVTGDLNPLGISLQSAFFGTWQLLNPFGSNQITSLLLQAQNTPKNGDNSDFSIALGETSDVPQPPTLGLLGIGLVGIGLAARRRRRSASSR